MNIQGPSNIHGAHGVKAPHTSNRPNGTQPSPATPNQATSAPSDQLDISAAGEAAAQAVESGGIRSDLVARVRNEIAAGTYETPERS